MKRLSAYLFSGAGICFVILFGWVYMLSSQIRSVQSELTSVRESRPGLGEYMTTIQLHVGKLWFAATASNWELAAYELDELKETMESAEKLRAVKNGVHIASVLDSVVQTQIAELSNSIARKNLNDFEKAYDETRSACNGCHESSGHKFIQIVRPATPPVTNQRWDLEPEDEP